MKTLVYSCALLAALLVGGISLLRDQFPESSHDPSVVGLRYPGEELHAKRLCRDRKLMYWWLEDPRKGAAVMHARCAGQVNVVQEVKF